MTWCSVFHKHVTILSFSNYLYKSKKLLQYRTYTGHFLTKRITSSSYQQHGRLKDIVEKWVFTTTFIWLMFTHHAKVLTSCHFPWSISGQTEHNYLILLWSVIFSTDIATVPKLGHQSQHAKHYKAIAPRLQQHRKRLWPSVKLPLSPYLPMCHLAECGAQQPPRCRPTIGDTGTSSG